MGLFFFITGVFLTVIPIKTSGQPEDILNYDESLRIDFVLTGNHSQQQATIAQYYKTAVYSAGKNQNLPPFDYGNYRILMISENSTDTLYLKGFCTLFEEWQSTEEARNVEKAFQQTLEMPFPNKPVKLIIEYRQKRGEFLQLINEQFKPSEHLVTTFAPPQHPYKTIHGSDNTGPQVDLLIMADGYTNRETAKFYADAKRMTEYLFSIAPYNDLKKHFTVRALAIPSQESGINNPRENMWKNTALKSSFNTFGTDRYLESFHTWTIYDHAAALPHDHVVILANSEKYGGGGVYNHFSITSADHSSSPRVLVHELGHGLAGLGDEYYSSQVAYSDFFDLETEPWHPNITTLVDFNSKWKHLLVDTVPVPTPAISRYKTTTGVFEGGGYSAKDIYRPAVNCRMKSNEAEGFCEVCQKSIKEMVHFLTR